MSTATTQYTVEQIRTAFNAAQQRLLPAKFKSTPEDLIYTERSVTQYMLAHQLAPTAENFYSAFKALVKSLPWAVKPASLVRDEQAEKPAVVQSARVSEGEFVAKVRAGEAIDAQAKKDEASIKQAKELIAGYNPVRNSRNGSVYDNAEREERQKLWTAALNQAVAGKQNLQQWVEALSAAIQKRYADREKAGERL